MNERLFHLLQQVRQGTVSQAQYRELMELIRTDDSEEAENAITAYRRLLPVDSDPYTEEEMDRLFTAILQAEIDPLKKSNTPVQPVRPMVIRYRRWVAAAIIISLFSGSYLWFRTHRQSVPTVVTMRPVNDALPGRNGAILTLSDGKNVVLDSLANGVVARQGGKDVKLQNGAVRYDEGSKAATDNNL